ncbi:response regulator transcription factor [Erythrobacter sp. NFXS35]|uniref:response regulator transcription factor n=1 Tax=Erythrobacter sp. NFXS35 TaxID=2818436 RepID=UPI0032DE58EF
MHRVVIADDHEIVRKGLAETLRSLGDCEIAGEACDGLETIAMAKALEPHLLLLDAAMPYARGIEVFSEIKRWNPKIMVAVVTGFTSAATLAQWLDAGVDGLFLKSCEELELRKGLRTILSGGQYICEASARILEQRPEAIQLTGREREVLALITNGLRNVEIGERLCISAKTVEKHRTSLMAKVGVQSLPALLTFALREGLLDEHRQL